MTFSSNAVLAVFAIVLIAPAECDVRCDLFEVDVQFEQGLPPGLARHPHRVHCRPEGSEEMFEVTDLPPGFSVSQNPFVDIIGATIDRETAKVSQPPGSYISALSRPNKGDRRSTLRRATTGDKTVLVVRVIASDASTSANPSSLSDSVFGTNGDPVNLKSQYAACSDNQLNFNPVSGTFNGQTVQNGVVEVTISNTVSGSDDGVIRNAVTSAVQAKYGSLGQWDHLMYCLPPGTNGGWIAYAYVNSQISVYNNQWCTYVSAQLHELGHNINLAHSNENGFTYEDQTGMMGYSYSSDDGPVMCFNNAKNWQLGWFSGCYSTVQPAAVGVTSLLLAPAEYSTASQCDTGAGEAVVIKVPVSGVGFYFVGYNKQTGVNSGTREAGNQVTVQLTTADPTATVADPLGVYTESDLKAKLSVGGEASLAGGVYIKFCSLVGGKAVVGVGLNTDPCSVAVCGDGIINGVETCDDGNTVSNDGCSSTCVVEVCGDGIVNNGESCDDGNTVSNDGCSSTCVVEVCGDGITNNGESCDDGNTLSGDGCSSTCLLEICGDGILTSDTEACDDGNTVSNDGCSSTCVVEVCGDGIINNGESCDDGNTVSDDGCSSTCVTEACGDGVMQTSRGETCDDGNTASNDGCSSTCILEICGDGIINNGESCDDGNTASGDGCSSTCVTEGCGDGVIQTSRGETCDDGNTVSNDGCSSTCVVEVCGDGITNNGESCDDGNTLSGDGCSSTCLLEICGDGILTSDTEACDDGNTASNDGCSSTCVVEVCGDGIINNGEECDGIAGTAPLCSDGCSGTVTCGSDCRWNSAVCADGICDAAEALSSCPVSGNTCSDCVRAAPSSFCGDGVCDISLDANGRAKEDSFNCNVDNGGDCQGTTGGKPKDRFYCGNDNNGRFVGCSDSRCLFCEAVQDQNACCGDGVCAVDAGETAVNCNADCEAECQVASDCDDGLFCTVDTCDGGVCVNGPDPCGSGLVCNEATDSCDAPPDCVASGDFPNCCCDISLSRLGGKKSSRTCYDNGVQYNFGQSCPANGRSAFVSGPEKEADTESANSTSASGLTPTATTLLAVVVVLSVAVIVLAVSLAAAMRRRRQPQQTQVVELPSGSETWEWGKGSSLHVASDSLKASKVELVQTDLEAAAGSV